MGAIKIIAVSCKVKELNAYLKLLDKAIQNGVMINEYNSIKGGAKIGRREKR